MMRWPLDKRFPAWWPSYPEARTLLLARHTFWKTAKHWFTQTNRYLMMPNPNHEIHKVVDEDTGEERYVLSLHGVWRPGSFESKEAVEHVVRCGLGDKSLRKLQDEANKGNGVITLAAAKAESASWNW